MAFGLTIIDSIAATTLTHANTPLMKHLDAVRGLI